MNHIKSFSVFVILLLISVAPIAVWAVSDDGRINEAAYLGGIAIYCNDAEGNLTSSAPKGFQLVTYNHEGQIILRLDGDRLRSYVDAANRGELTEPFFVGGGTSRQGAVNFSYYVLPNGKFQVSGVDEYTNAFSFEWEMCTPVSAPESIVTSSSVTPAIAPVPPPVLPPFVGGPLPPEGGPVDCSVTPLLC